MQTLLVAMLVVGCTGYAAWTLMPSAARKSLAGALLKLPSLPPGLSARLQRAATASSGCGCDGCDGAPKAGKAPKAAVPAQQTITFHPRIRH